MADAQREAPALCRSRGPAVQPVEGRTCVRVLHRDVAGGEPAETGAHRLGKRLFRGEHACGTGRRILFFRKIGPLRICKNAPDKMRARYAFSNSLNFDNVGAEPHAGTPFQALLSFYTLYHEKSVPTSRAPTGSGAGVPPGSAHMGELAGAAKKGRKLPAAYAETVSGPSGFVFSLRRNRGRGPAFPVSCPDGT